MQTAAKRKLIDKNANPFDKPYIGLRIPRIRGDAEPTIKANISIIPVAVAR